jgi:tryptophan-rich sensory protein
MTPARGSVAKPAALALLVAVAASALGGLATDVGPWYQALAKPSWQPPDWLFGPVWTTIYAFAVIAATLAWRHAPDTRARRRLVIAFAINLALNLGWSVLFFHLQRPDLALYEVGLLWLSIAALVVIIWPWTRLGAALLLPYLAWVGFAAWLNFTIVQLNGNFPGR